MAASKMTVLQNQFAQAQQELEAAADNIKAQLKELVTRAQKAEAADTGFVIAIASPVPEGSITHGSLAKAHREFQAAVQKLETIRKEARKTKQEQEAATAAKAKQEKKTAKKVGARVK